MWTYLESTDFVFQVGSFSREGGGRPGGPGVTDQEREVHVNSKSCLPPWRVRKDGKDRSGVITLVQRSWILRGRGRVGVHKWDQQTQRTKRHITFLP